MHKSGERERREGTDGRTGKISRGAPENDQGQDTVQGLR